MREARGGPIHFISEQCAHIKTPRRPKGAAAGSPPPDKEARSAQRAHPLFHLNNLFLGARPNKRTRSARRRRTEESARRRGGERGASAVGRVESIFTSPRAVRLLDLIGFLEAHGPLHPLQGPNPSLAMEQA